MEVESNTKSLLNGVTVWIDGEPAELRAAVAAIHQQLAALGPRGIAGHLGSPGGTPRVVLLSSPPETTQEIPPYSVVIVLPGIADDPHPPCVIWQAWVHGSAPSGAPAHGTEVLATWMHRVAAEATLLVRGQAAP